MRKIKLIPLIFPAIFGGHTHAQTINRAVIKGSVSDEHQKALPYVTIQLKAGRDSVLYKTVTTNETGGFTLTGIKDGYYFLDISIVGFSGVRMQTLLVDSSHRITDIGVIVLKGSGNMLTGVTVTSGSPLIERQIDKKVVNTDRNITNDGTTVLELMQKLPGIHVTADGQVSMNGKAGVSVYIDGKPTYLSAADLAALLASMPAAAVQKIEIMTNPSAKYDAAGTAGIINIVKKKNHKAGFNGSMTGNLTEGHYPKYNGGITMNYKNDLYNIYLNNSYAYDKRLLGRDVSSSILNTDRSLLTKQVSQNKEINARGTYRPLPGIDLYLSSRSTLSFSGTGSINNSDVRTTSGMDILDGSYKKISREDFGSTVKDKPFNYSATMQFLHQLDTAGKEFTVDLDYADYKNKPTQNNRIMLEDEQNNLVSVNRALLLQYRSLNIYAAKADYVRPLKNKVRIEAGIKTSYVKAVNDNNYYNQAGVQSIIDSSQTNNSVNTESISAGYLNFNKEYKKLKIEAGMRAERTRAKGRQIVTGESVDQNYFQLFPSVFIDYKMSERNSFDLQLGRRTERPAYAEMVPFRRPLTATLFFQGNPNLKPHLSYHGEVTWSYQSVFFVTFAYDIDHDYVQTIPYLDSNKTTITRRPTNVARARSWDINFAWSKKLAAWYSTDNSLLLYQNGFGGNVNGFSLNNPGIVSIYASSNNSFRLTKRISAEADLEYNSKRHLITSSFGAYSILSIGFKCQLFNNKGSVSINAHNVLQSENHNAIDRYSGLDQYSYFYFYTRSAGINLTYLFGAGKATKSRASSGAAEEQSRAGN
ncbi:MAG TPA: TonB-dependent receptor [Puia sp.]